uniref:Putative secreted protein n=1 Tax=Anopheles darlingi TaxID=43151 RepID=A0A2M4D400_ANODA
MYRHQFIRCVNVTVLVLFSRTSHLNLTHDLNAKDLASSVCLSITLRLVYGTHNERFAAVMEDDGAKPIIVVLPVIQVNVNIYFYGSFSRKK